MLTKCVYLENYGCPSNKFDLNLMSTSLQDSGYRIVEDVQSADILIINTCGVKKPTEDRILHRLAFLRTLEKPIVVAGCLPKIDIAAIEKAVPNYLALLDPHSVNKIVEAVECAGLC